MALFATDRIRVGAAAICLSPPLPLIPPSPHKPSDLVDAGPGEGQEHVDIPQYGLNLAEIYRRLAPRARHVVWTTTTPCPNVTTSMGRTDAKVQAYNAAALTALQAAAAARGEHLVVDDLYAAVDGYCGANYKTCDLQRPANVHFEPKGCEFMAKHVVQTVLAVLHPKQP